MEAAKKIYPVAASDLGTRLQHWAITLKPVEAGESSEVVQETLIEFAPCGVIINPRGLSAHRIFLAPGQTPECRELGKTSKTMPEIKLWIFETFKILRDENFDGFGIQREDVLVHDMVSMNCQDFAVMLAEYLGTPIDSHTQANEIIGGVAAVAGLGLAGFSAPVIISGAAVLAGVAATGLLEDVTENTGIARVGSGVSKLAGGVDYLLGGAASQYLRNTITAPSDFDPCAELVEVETEVCKERIRQNGYGNPEACPICLDSLCGEPLGVCLGADRSRSCLHYFHLRCLRRVEGAHCPQCRQRFHRRAPFPSLEEDVAIWLPLASLESPDGLDRHEVSALLKATLCTSPDVVDELVDTFWRRWVQDSEFLYPDMVPIMYNDIKEYMPKTASSTSSASDARACTVQETDESEATHDDFHSTSGMICRCGQIHVRRGDRVRRGPAAPHEIDGPDVVSGYLGTIVRVGEFQESVFVKWDRTAPNKVNRYTWPDPDGQVLAPASFEEVAEDLEDIMKDTGLSSFAAEELLRRFGYKKQLVVRNVGQNPQKYREEKLRRTPMLFHQIRILPDKELVQEWFDRIPACQCKKPNCRGGLMWSSRAGKHVGREALVMRIDDGDQSVLVETIGPCQCQVWYPRLAVEPVYNLDLADSPQFEVGSRVECRMSDGWQAGAVTEVLWHGSDRRGPCPYAVSLDDGRDVFVPNCNLIRPLTL